MRLKTFWQNMEILLMKEQYLIITKNIVTKWDIAHHDQFVAPLAESQSRLCHGELSGLCARACVRILSAFNEFG